MSMMTMLSSSRVEQLKELLSILAGQIDSKPGARDMAGLARQYRETLKEIEEIEGTDGEQDEIGEILAERSADGKSGAVRPDRTGI